MPRRLVADFAFARAGDKGDVADLTLFAPDRAVYDLLAAQVTAGRVQELLGGFVLGDVTRYEVPNVLALKFVCEQALGGGGPASLRADNLGKALAGALLHLEVDVPDELPAGAGGGGRPPPPPPWSAACRGSCPGRGRICSSRCGRRSADGTPTPGS
jgi:hypothetical protein